MDDWCIHDLPPATCSICNGAEQRYRDAEKQRLAGAPKPQPSCAGHLLPRGGQRLPDEAYVNLPNESARWDFASWKVQPRSKYHPERLQGATLPTPGTSQ